MTTIVHTKYTQEEIEDIQLANSIFSNPDDYEIRMTQFSDCYKIIDKKNNLSYTSGIEMLKKRKIIESNIQDKEYYKQRIAQEGYKFEKDNQSYLMTLYERIYDMIDIFHFYFPELLESKKLTEEDYFKN